MGKLRLIEALLFSYIKRYQIQDSHRDCLIQSPYFLLQKKLHTGKVIELGPGEWIKAPEGGWGRAL